MKYIAIKNSYGFRGRYWEKGTVITVTEDELKCKELKHFEEIGKAKLKTPKPIKQKMPKDPLQIKNEGIAAKVYVDQELLELRSEYMALFGKEVPVNKKNNKVWIMKQIEEAK